uniref:Uncharacterized protein n=2 Tax=Choreotrichia TaxID=141411 RepID=A0A7S3SRF2_9SPIT|eukprot:scaffold43178_cov33-Tisochrysis_lutea.AAC.1
MSAIRLLYSLLLSLSGSLCNAYLLSRMPRTNIDARAPRSLMLADPLSLSFAFAAGAAFPSAVAVQKQKELDAARAEFEEQIAQLETSIKTSDKQLGELLVINSRQARQKKDEFVELQRSYNIQLERLKEMVGEFSDKYELQQNECRMMERAMKTMERENLQYKERGAVLMSQLEESQSKLQQAMDDIANSPFEKNPILRNPFVKKMAMAMRMA